MGGRLGAAKLCDAGAWPGGQRRVSGDCRVRQGDIGHLGMTPRNLGESMAGKRQHYVPRFLQRGFLHDPSEEAERTWLHRRGVRPKLVSIRDIGVSDYFYSKLRDDGVVTLDDMITAVEGPLDAELSVLRKAQPDEIVDPISAAKLVTHLAWRTAHFRSVFTMGASEMLDEFAEAFGDPDAMRSQLGVDGLDPQGVLGQKIDEVFATAPYEALGLPNVFLRRVGSAFLRENFPAFYEEYGVVFLEVLRSLRQEASEHVRAAHQRVLADPSDNQRQAEMEGWSWRVQHVEGAILPDCVALVQELGGAFAPLMLSSRENTERVVMPITHDRLLIGEVTPGPALDIAEVNRASAASAENFFIARRSCADQGLGETIGTRSGQVIQDQITDALADFRAAAPDSTPPAWLATPHTTRSFSWTLQCSGFPDDESVQGVNDILRVIVDEMARGLPLDTLDGITFTYDYAETLAQLDRGDPNLPAANSAERDYGTAVAQSVEVVRDGERKCHIVIHAAVGLELLAEEKAQRTVAAHVVASQLADVAHNVLYAAQVNGRYGWPSDNVSRRLYPTASAAPGRYFCARESAFVDAEAGEQYASLVRDSWATTRAAMEGARAAFYADQNVDELLATILPRLSQVMSHIAEWLGHRDGLPEGEGFSGADLVDDFRVEELDKWLELFARDLRDLHDIEGRFTPEAIFALGRHVERLLWTMQILAWPLEDGNLYVLVGPGAPATN